MQRHNLYTCKDPRDEYRLVIIRDSIESEDKMQSVFLIKRSNKTNVHTENVIIKLRVWCLSK